MQYFCSTLTMEYPPESAGRRTRMTKKKRRSTGAFNAITSCISTTLVLVLLGLIVFFVTTAHNLSRSVRENFTVQVMLSDSLGDKQTRAMQAELSREPYVRRVSYTSKDDATREQAEALGTDPAEFLGTSPIPASFELHLKADYANNDSLARYLPALTGRSEIIDVVYPRDLMDNVNHNIRQISAVLLIVAVLLTFVSFSLINNTMRLNIYARRFTIHTMKMVGARRSFIRRPFMARAFWIGAISALLADGLLAGGIILLLDWDPGLTGLIDLVVWGATMGSVAVCGILLTVICAFFSVNKHLRMNTAQVFVS